MTELTILANTGETIVTQMKRCPTSRQRRISRPTWGNPIASWQRPRPGTAAESVDGITVHSACKFSKERPHVEVGYADVDGFTLGMPAGLRIDDQTRIDWQKKHLQHGR
jgi:hypothetical protein